jgi:hypothetical protein
MPKFEAIDSKGQNATAFHRVLSVLLWGVRELGNHSMTSMGALILRKSPAYANRGWASAAFG